MLILCDTLCRRSALLAPALLVGAALGQVGPAPATQGFVDAPLKLSRTAGLHLLDDVLIGVGDGYLVRFSDSGFEFTPALDVAATERSSMVFRLESIGREGSLPAPASLAPCAPVWGDLRVDYDRGIAIERYDIGVDAMEQSFVFRERPAGTGDLVVRGRIETQFTVTPDGSGLRLERPGLGGFHFGGVTGIDARGRRVEGCMRFAAGVLELSLPAAFVDSAALPLTLDPLVGNVFRVTTTATDVLPEVAYDATTGNYLVVWNSGGGVHGHRISRSGLLVASRLVIATVGIRPDVANVNDLNVFVVVYSDPSVGISGRIVKAADGVVSASAIIASDFASAVTPTVAGSRAGSILNPGIALCAWTLQGFTFSEVRAARLTVDPSRRPVISVGPVRIVAATGAAQPSRPQLAVGDGSVGRYALTFLRRVAGPAHVQALVLDSGAQPITPEMSVDLTTADQFRCRIDGDGTNWVVGWVEAGLPSAIKARSLRYVSGGAALVAVSSTRSLGSTSLDLAPSVIWTGESCLVSRSTSATRISSLDLLRCTDCEGSLNASSFLDVSPLTGCGTISAGGPSEEALIVGGDTSGLIAQLFRAVDGDVTVRGSACGRGGTAFATCARSPNSRFAHRLLGAVPNAATAFILSGSESPFTCGSCTLVPDLGSAIVVATTTNPAGDAEVPFGIVSNSSLRGVPLFEQWVTVDLATPACSQFLLDFSSALRVVIE